MSKFNLRSKVVVKDIVSDNDHITLTPTAGFSIKLNGNVVLSSLADDVLKTSQNGTLVSSGMKVDDGNLVVKSVVAQTLSGIIVTSTQPHIKSIGGYTLPAADGMAGQVLTTDGAGTLVWTDQKKESFTIGNTASAAGQFLVTDGAGTLTFVTLSPDIVVSAGDIRSGSLAIFDDRCTIASAPVTIEKGSLDVPAAYKIAGKQVIGPRETGWTPMSGVADRGTAIDPDDLSLSILAQRIKAIQDTLAAHGLIGQ